MKPNSPLLAGLGLALSALIGAVVVWGRTREVVVPRVGAWEDTPILCARDVPEADLLEAIGWWGALGHPVILGCSSWTISLDVDPTIDPRASVDDHEIVHGLTVTHTDRDEVVAAEIRVLPGAGALVIAHEIGHSLGFFHPRAAPSGHMMHPSRPGWDSRGLAR